MNFESKNKALKIEPIEIEKISVLELLDKENAIIDELLQNICFKVRPVELAKKITQNLNKYFEDLVKRNTTITLKKVPFVIDKLLQLVNPERALILLVLTSFGIRVSTNYLDKLTEILSA